jgi:uncharacterized SAM-binding protein YcdF (DUF218 family)
MTVGTLVVLLVATAVAGQAWFWYLRVHEERSLWYGLSFLFAIGTLALVVETMLVAGVPFGDHPVLQQANLVVLVLLVVLLALFPVALVVTLVVSGVRLIRREGARPSNLLSLGLGILMVAYVAVWPLVRDKLVSLPIVGGALDLAFGLAAIVLGVLSAVFTLYTISGALAQIPHRRRRYAHVVVLGAGLAEGRTVTPLLARRVDRGVRAWRDNPGSILVMSGGQGPDEQVSEASAMAEYAVSQGVPREAIVLEDRSRNTRENIANSFALTSPDGGDVSRRSRAVVVTDDYHVFRALLLTRELGVRCDGLGSRVRLYFSLNALVREWAAYVSLRRRLYTRVMIALAAVYVAAWLFGTIVGG